VPSITKISSASFHSEVVDVDEPVIVEFYSDSCSHCINFKPVYEELSEILKSQAKFVKLNVSLNEDHKALAHFRGVRALPTLEVFYKGRVIGNVVGYHDFDSLSEMIKGILSKKEEHVGSSTPFKYSHS
jgi:thioredoxin 1